MVHGADAEILESVAVYCIGDPENDDHDAKFLHLVSSGATARLWRAGSKDWLLMPMRH